MVRGTVMARVRLKFNERAIARTSYSTRDVIRARLLRHNGRVRGIVKVRVMVWLGS
jgi:hypothetical protein